MAHHHADLLISAQRLTVQSWSQKQKCSALQGLSNGMLMSFVMTFKDVNISSLKWRLLQIRFSVVYEQKSIIKVPVLVNSFDFNKPNLNLRLDHILGFFFMTAPSQWKRPIRHDRSLYFQRPADGARGRRKNRNIKMEDNHTMAEMERNQPPFSLGIKENFFVAPFWSAKSQWSNVRLDFGWWKTPLVTSFLSIFRNVDIQLEDGIQVEIFNIFLFGPTVRYTTCANEDVDTSEQVNEEWCVTLQNDLFLLCWRTLMMFQPRKTVLMNRIIKLLCVT